VSGARASGAAELAPEELVREIARYAAEKKAIDLVELDLRGVLGYTDYFLVCSGNTGRQAKAIHDGILEGLKHEHGVFPRRVEGSAEAGWIPADARVLPPRAALGRGSRARRRRALSGPLTGEAPAR
jgi:ribosomal silencing factor RsfS